MTRLAALLALVALTCFCAVVRADDTEVYDPYWAVVFPAPPASFDFDNAAQRAAYFSHSPKWYDLSTDEAFMDGVPHVSHVATPVKKTTTTARVPAGLDLNNGCQAAAGHTNPDGSITYCSASISTCTPGFCPGCDDRPPCTACLGRDLHFISGTSVSPYEAPTPNFITQNYPLGTACPEDLLGVPDLGKVQGIQVHFPITIALRAVAPFGGTQVDRSYIVNDPCVTDYALTRIEQILDNGNDAPIVTTSPNTCDIWNSAGVLGAISLQNVATPPGFPTPCYSKALVIISVKALTIPDAYSHGGTFSVNKACVAGLRDAYLAAASSCTPTITP